MKVASSGRCIVLSTTRFVTKRKSNSYT